MMRSSISNLTFAASLSGMTHLARLIPRCNSRGGVFFSPGRYNSSLRYMQPHTGKLIELDRVAPKPA